MRYNNAEAVVTVFTGPTVDTPNISDKSTTATEANSIKRWIQLKFAFQKASLEMG